MGSLEPWDLPANFLQLFENSRLMPHMHLPMQSGSDTVLKRMSRRCKTNEFRDLVTEARRLIPNLNITSDIIVGFPGETHGEWQQTLDFVEEMAFGDLHIFTYSTREGTKAATMPDQVENVIKKSRSKALHEVSKNLKQSSMASVLGATCDVLWEDNTQQQDDGLLTVFGYTPHYLRVKISTTDPAQLINTITRCRLSALEDNVFIAQPV